MHFDAAEVIECVGLERRCLVVVQEGKAFLPHAFAHVQCAGVVALAPAVHHRDECAHLQLHAARRIKLLTNRFEGYHGAYV